MSTETTPAATPTATPASTPELQPSAAPAPAAATPPDGGATPAPTASQPPVEGQPQPPAPAAPPSDPQQPSRVEKRFGDLTKQRNDAQAEAAYWRGVAEGRGGTPPAPQPATPAAPAGPPDHNDAAKYPLGQFDPRYAADLAKHELRAEQEAERKAEAARTAQAETARTLEEGVQRWEGVVEEARNAGQGFENAESVLLARDVPRATMDLIVTAENKLHVAEYFGRKPEAKRALLSLPPIEQARAIGRLDAIISGNLRAAGGAAPQSPPPPPPAAPQPSPAPIPTAVQSGPASSFNASTAAPADVDARLAELRAKKAEGGGSQWGRPATRL